MKNSWRHCKCFTKKYLVTKKQLTLNGITKWTSLKLSDYDWEAVQYMDQRQVNMEDFFISKCLQPACSNSVVNMAIEHVYTCITKQYLLWNTINLMLD